MNTLKFDLPKDKSSIIKVLGVGGGGGNAVNHMFSQGIKGVDFVICNTDLQALEASAIPNKIQLGASLTSGLGAGADPDKGHKAAMEAIEDIIEVLGVNTKMLFITAGMGGGTGTGAAPVIAKAARELDILTVGIVTTPFSFEGKKRKGHAEEGIEQLKRSVDCLLVINNDKIKSMYGNLPLRTAFSHANDILTIAAKGIAEIITDTGYINVDFEDVKTVMRNSGVALMGSASADGENRAVEAAKAALASPLLNDNQIRGAKNILLNISFGTSEVLMDEIDIITSYIQEQAGQTADVIFGTSIDETLGEKISVTLICTGFESRDNKIIFHSPEVQNIEQKTKHVLYETPVKPNMIIGNPLENLITPKVEKVEEIIEPVVDEIQPVEEETIRHELIVDTQDNIQQIEPVIEQPTNIENELEEEEETEEVMEPFLKTITPVNENEVPPIKEPEQELNIDEPVAFNTVNEEETLHFSIDEEFQFEEQNQQVEQEERIKQSIARLKKIKELNLQISSPGGVRDLEKEPAYIRRQKKLNEVPHSSEQSVF